MRREHYTHENKIQILKQKNWNLLRKKFILIYSRKVEYQANLTLFSTLKVNLSVQLLSSLRHERC